MEKITSPSLTDWPLIAPKAWVQKSLSISERGLTINHEFHSSTEVNLPAGLKHHSLAFGMGHIQRLVNRFDGREYDAPYTPGDTFLLPSQTSSFHCGKSEPPVEVMIFSIEPQRLQQLATENDCLHPDRLELRPILQCRDLQIEAIAYAFRTEMYSGEFGNKLYRESLANLFLIHLLRRYCTQTPRLRTYECGLSRCQLQISLNFIHDHLGGEFKLQAVADQLGMSQYYFCRLFKQSMGVSPYQYVLQQRVERAKQLLKQPGRAIADIALECGFSDQSQMTHHFRKLTNTTPRAYRQTCLIAPQ